ncbi:hypothetical protein DICPUDRAFT_81310 [Dictyostelium purpureum]|uniref:Protein kinase domain-containing protein n=1 Tax=Dictyostelium purpureum TaxID=5786 RepID=F0ZT40_DICPU|nr:uncharacterized protein DICPUDRAFT_81310 [Dictyostelium purpureum]EGC32892.1 hypothetical protein DICPUDRAFT_81310 [Dictyostelium purpureum]|eukprot:XP_003290577.1 hypothetical protein DICPUDRAFT_81310 [Dictyostelium purpureum]
MDGSISLTSSNGMIATPRPSSATINNNGRAPAPVAFNESPISNARVLLFKNILLLQDIDFFVSLLDHFSRCSSTPKSSELLNSLITIMDDNFIELLRLFIKQTVENAKLSLVSDESSPTNYQSFNNIINKMSSSFLKIYLAPIMEKVLSTQISNFTDDIQEFLKTHNSGGGSTNSTPTNPSALLASSPLSINSSGVRNSSNNLESLDISNNISNSPTNRASANSIGNTLGTPPIIGMHHQISTQTSQSNNNLTPLQSPSFSSTPPISSPTSSTQITLEGMKDHISKYSISIINTIFRSVEKIPPNVFQLFELLYIESHQLHSSEYSLELVKKIFFTKLICPILANLKPPPNNSTFFSKVYIEISKVVFDIAFDRDFSRRGVTTQEQVMHFIKSLVFRSHSLSGGASPQQAQQTHLISSQMLSLQQSKDEAVNSFILQIKSEASELEESFKRAKDLNTSLQRAERQIFLFGVFKDLLNNYKNSFSNFGISSPSMGPRSNHFSTLRGNTSRTNSPVPTLQNLINPYYQTPTQVANPGEVQATRVLQSLSKKWSSEELRSTYNGKSPKKRSWVLDRKNSKTQVINLTIVTDQYTVYRIITLPLNITVQALASRIHTDTEFSDLSLNKEEYEMVVRYSEENSLVLNDENNQEVICEPELPLWMFDISPNDTLVFRPSKKRLSTFNIFLKFIFPNIQSNGNINTSNGNSKVTPIIVYVNLQSTPQSILDEKLSKLLPQLDTAHLGFYLRDIDDESSSLSSIKMPNNNPFALNKISTMDVIECSPRLSYEFSISIKGRTQSILLDFDSTIDSVSSAFYNICFSLEKEPPLSTSNSIDNLSGSGSNTPPIMGDLRSSTGSFNSGNTSSNSSRTNSGAMLNSDFRKSGQIDQVNYSLALISNTNFLPMFLPGSSKLQDYCFNHGDELILVDRCFISLVENLAQKRKPIPLSSSLSQSTVYHSSQYHSNYNGVSSMSLLAEESSNKIIARVKVTWAGTNNTFDRQSPFINTSLNVNINSISNLSLNDVLSNPSALNSSANPNRPFLSTTIAQDNTFACTSKNDYCLNNQVKLCIVGEETPEKLQFYNSLRKNYSPNGLLSFSSSRGIPAFFSNHSSSIPDISLDNSFVHNSELIVGQDSDQVTFKTFYLSGNEQHQSIHPLFISPQSMFIITYNAVNINTILVNYWLEIIQSKAPGSVVFLVGLCNQSIDERKFANFKADHQKLFRFNNIGSYMNVSLKNSKQIKLLANKLQKSAEGKQFQYKIPLSYSILKSQCQESAKEAIAKGKMPISSVPFIKNISRILGIEPRDSEAAIKYLHEIGEILFYKYEANDEILNDLVFLDCIWVSKLITAILSLKTQNGMTVFDQVSTSWENIFSTYIIKSLLTLLEKLELIYLNSEDGSVIIPQLFGADRPTVMRDLWSPTAHATNEYKRVYDFKFLPHGFFSRLSVRILQHYDPLCIWKTGILIQPQGQLWGGASKSYDSQCLIEYEPSDFSLKISIRDDHKSQLLKSIVDLVSSFILWYFPGRLNTVQVACTHCTTLHIENPTLYSLDYLEKQSSLGQTQVICKAQLGGAIHETLSPRTTKVDINALAFEVAINSQKFSLIPYEDLKFGPQLGSGSYATVYRGIWNNSEVAIKLLNLDDGQSANTTERFREFRNEAHITGELRHTNTVSLMGVSVNPFCLITELLQQGDLAKFIRNTAEPFSWNTVFKLSMDIAKGMSFLHSCKPMIVHRDLKSANILLGGSSIETLVAKVSDFGLSIKPIGKEVKGRKVWNWRWLAPEIMNDQQYTEKIDVYSFAIVLWEIITRDLPFEEYVDQLKWNSIIEDKIIKGLRPTIPDECPSEMKNLITDCWNGDPKKRPSFTAILDRLNQMFKTFPLEEKLEFYKQLPPLIDEPVVVNVPPLPSSIQNLQQIAMNNNLNSNGSNADFKVLLTPTSLQQQNGHSGSSNHGGNGIGTTTATSSNSDTNSGSSGVYESGGSLTSSGSSRILRYQSSLALTFPSTIHSLYSVINSKNESFVWCGMGDGSVCVINPNTRQTVSSSRFADASRILSFCSVRKKGKSSLPTPSCPSTPFNFVDDDTQIWAIYGEGILVFESKTYKLLKTIKTNYITTCIDEGTSVWTNCKEKTSYIKSVSKSGLKTKKLLNVKTMDSQITTIFINYNNNNNNNNNNVGFGNSGVGQAPRVWLGTDNGMVFILDYPNLTPVAHHISHNGGSIHSIKKMDRLIITCSERVICIFDESGIIKKKIEGLTSRVLSILVVENYIIGACYDSTILVWDSKQSFRCVQVIKKKHIDAISSVTLSVSQQNKPQLWVGSWDKKISTYQLTEELEHLLTNSYALQYQQHQQSAFIPVSTSSSTLSFSGAFTPRTNTIQISNSRSKLAFN